MKDKLAASKYAKAFFELAFKSKELKEISKEMEFFISLLNKEKKLLLIFKHPTISKDNKIELLNNLIDKQAQKTLLFSFLELLIYKNSMTLIDLIYAELKRLDDEYGRRQLVFVESMKTLKNEDKKSLQDELSGILDKSVELEVSINPDLLGGLKVAFDYTVFDASLKRQLEILKENLV